MGKLQVFVTDYTIADVMDVEQAILDGIGAEIIRAQCTTEAEVLAQIGDPDAIITQWAPVTRKVLSGLTQCKVISRNGIGVDNIDLQACRDLGVAVLNIPAYCIPEVADHALALALALCRKLQPIRDLVASGTWTCEPLIAPVRRLSELSFGIIGLGRIGRAVADRARPIFREVVACDPHIDDDEFCKHNVCKKTHEEVFAEADIVTLHVPLKDDTRHLVNAERLNLMKPGSYIINTCRGPVVDTNAVVAALESGQLAGAGLDVHDPEPLPMDHPLRRFGNVIVTPHVAYYSAEAVLQARRETAQNIVLFTQGKEPISRLV
jgi:D-3-phosphoglycerate dehydrogenase / 2-oxoglutarate reductase